MSDIGSYSSLHNWYMCIAWEPRKTTRSRKIRLSGRFGHQQRFVDIRQIATRFNPFRFNNQPYVYRTSSRCRKGLRVTC